MEMQQDNIEVKKIVEQKEYISPELKDMGSIAEITSSSQYNSGLDGAHGYS